MDGVLNIRKEKGYTSFDVVAKLRGILHMKKIGHTGTLDPEAEGVLPVVLGKATKLVDLLTEKQKTYEALLHLGLETDTQDMTGTVLEEKPVEVTEEEVRTVIRSFLGEQQQIPPMYSALKVDGHLIFRLEYNLRLQFLYPAALVRNPKLGGKVTFYVGDYFHFHNSLVPVLFNARIKYLLYGLYSSAFSSVNFPFIKSQISSAAILLIFFCCLRIISSAASLSESNFRPACTCPFIVFAETLIPSLPKNLRLAVSHPGMGSV